MRFMRENLCDTSVTYIPLQGQYTYVYSKASIDENLCVTNMHVDYVCPCCDACAPIHGSNDFLTKSHPRDVFASLGKRKPFPKKPNGFTR